MDIPDSGPDPQDQYYYDDEANKFWMLSRNKVWIKVTKEMLRLDLRRIGFAGRAGEGDDMPAADGEINRITRENHVIYAGPLAGHDPGLIVSPCGLVLVTTPTKLMLPRPGEWPYLERFISGLLGDQDVYLYAWIKLAYAAYRTRRFRPGQVLALMGAPGCGKSLMQELITEVFGREGRPFRYFSGKTTFNSELFGAEHLAIGDEAAGTDIRTRRQLGQELKKLAAESVHSCHKKGKEAFPLSPMWRGTLTGNHEAENMMVLPPLDVSLLDKVMLLLCKEQTFVMPPGVEAYRGFKEALVKELPAMLHWLESVDLPDELRDRRYGVKAYQDPELLELLSSHSPEEKLWDIIQDVIFEGDEAVRDELITTSAALERTLLERHRGASRVLTFPTAVGAYLARLHAKGDMRVSKGQSRTSWILRKVLKTNGIEHE